MSSIQSNGWLRISGQSDTNELVRLYASPDLVRWREIAVLHGSSFTFTDPVSAEAPHRFYRFSSAELAETNDWKNQISLPGFYSPERFTDDGGTYVKFAIATNEPARVYYANGKKYLFHYDFATRRLEPTFGVGAEEFERMSLYNDGRKVILGAVIFPHPRAARGPFPEYGIQFVSRDPLSRELVRGLFELVRSTVISTDDVRVFYIPTFEQNAAAQTDREWFENSGIPLATMDRWVQGNACYSMGWAVGTLKYFGASEVEAAYADGRLGPEDILLTDGVPAELPHVAGIITLSPSTPNSHVAILARSYGVPFVYTIVPELRARAMALVGRDVALQLYRTANIVEGCRADLVPLDPTFSVDLKAEIVGLKQPPSIRVAPMARYGAYTAPTDNLTPANIRFFGGKAANYGLLRRTIPSNAPAAIAISFDVWTEFITQTMPGGKTLWQEITNRLAGYSFPADITAIKTNLAAIRTLIRQGTRFTTNQEQAIISALRVFDSRRNIRFRSSTNVEDTETFTGAGLYDSYSGCLDDDLDGDTSGPSHCDPTEEEERGVFRAIRRVFASFYNDNAYIERLRHGVDESSVGMAILVHHSTPDDIEMANGVAVVQAYEYETTRTFSASLVTQKGATSVANPDGTALPETVSAYKSSPDHPPSLTFGQNSSLLPMGGRVLDWPDDYTQLSELLFRVARAYRAMTAKQGTFQLDFEYKKVAPGWLEVKQVRELPVPILTNDTAQYVFNNPVLLGAYQGVDNDLYATHQLKSRWTISTRNGRVGSSNLTSGLLTHVTVEHMNGDRIETLSGPVQSFRNYSNAVTFFTNQGWAFYDSWHMPMVGGTGTVTLITFLYPRGTQDPMFVRPSHSLHIHYDPPAPHRMSRTGMTMRATEMIGLATQRTTTTLPQDVVVDTSYTFTEGATNVTITPTYVRGPPGIFGDTRLLIGGIQTRIEGLTTEPIVLTNYFSQTVSFGHLGAGVAFVFEPRLEPGMSRAILDELERLDIRQLSLANSAWGQYFATIGRDGLLRPFGTLDGQTMTVRVTRSDGWPFAPVGTIYTLSFNGGTIYDYSDNHGNQGSGAYFYQRNGNTATMTLNHERRYTLTFESENGGPIRGTYGTSTEESTFTLHR